MHGAFVREDAAECHSRNCFALPSPSHLRPAKPLHFRRFGLRPGKKRGASGGASPSPFSCCDLVRSREDFETLTLDPSPWRVCCLKSNLIARDTLVSNIPRAAADLRQFWGEKSQIISDPASWILFLGHLHLQRIPTPTSPHLNPRGPANTRVRSAKKDTRSVWRSAIRAQDERLQLALGELVDEPDPKCPWPLGGAFQRTGEGHRGGVVTAMDHLLGKRRAEKARRCQKRWM